MQDGLLSVIPDLMDKLGFTETIGAFLLNDGAIRFLQKNYAAELDLLSNSFFESNKAHIKAGNVKAAEYAFDAREFVESLIGSPI